MATGIQTVCFRVVVAGVLTSAPRVARAQDFEVVTQRVEMDFANNDGVFVYPPINGVPIPEPKTAQPEIGWVVLGHKSTIACTIVIHPQASVTEKSAARELAAQIAYLAGTTNRPEIVSSEAAITTPAVCVLGVAPELFQQTHVDVPPTHQGFTIQSGQWKGADAVFVAGRDRFGVYYGIQTLKQMLFREDDPRKHGSLPPETGGVLCPLPHIGGTGLFHKKATPLREWSRVRG